MFLLGNARLHTGGKQRRRPKQRRAIPASDTVLIRTAPSRKLGHGASKTMDAPTVSCASINATGSVAPGAIRDHQPVRSSAMLRCRSTARVFLFRPTWTKGNNPDAIRRLVSSIHRNTCLARPKATLLRRGFSFGHVQREIRTIRRRDNSHPTKRLLLLV